MLPAWVRDLILFVGGLAGFLHELAITRHERPSLLAASLVMMGLPLPKLVDRRAHTRNRKDRR